LKKRFSRTTKFNANSALHVLRNGSNVGINAGPVERSKAGCDLFAIEGFADFTEMAEVKLSGLLHPRSGFDFADHRRLFRRRWICVPIFPGQNA